MKSAAVHWMLFAVIMALLSVHSLRLGLVDWRDAMAYWEAAENLRDGGDGMYARKELESRGRPFVYPPSFAAAFAPFTYWDDRPDMHPGERGLMDPYPFPSSLYVWGFLHLVAVPLACVMMSRVLRRKWWDVHIATGVCLGAFGTVAMDAFYGNINIFIMLGLAIAGALAVKRRYFWAGFLLGVGGMFKIMPFVLIPLLMLRAPLRAGLGGLLGALLTWLLPLLFLAPQLGLLDGLETNIILTREYVENWVLPSVSSMKFTQGGAFKVPNHSPLAGLQRLFGEGTQLTPVVWDKDDVGPMLFALPGGLLKLAALGITAGLYLWSGWLWFRSKSRANALLALGMAFTAASMANVNFWHYHVPGMALVGGAMIVEARHADQRKWRKIVLFFVLMTFGFTGPSLLRTYGMAHFVQVMKWGIPTWSILLACILALTSTRRGSGMAEAASL
ncbi:MAG: glycosyltransferase family 87 protein [Planctomycetota bacterium]